MGRFNQSSAPIYEALEEFEKNRDVPFDVPGHKQTAYYAVFVNDHPESHNSSLGTIYYTFHLLFHGHLLVFPCGKTNPPRIYPRKKMVEQINLYYLS